MGMAEPVHSALRCGLRFQLLRNRLKRRLTVGIHLLPTERQVTSCLEVQ